MNSSNQHLVDMLRERVDQLVADGHHEDAIHAANALVEKSQQALSTDYDSIDFFVASLELRGELFQRLNDLDKAIEDIVQAIDQLDNRPEERLHIGQLLAALGAFYDQQGDFEEASRAWKQAIDIFESHEPPAKLDAAIMSNNLGSLKKLAGETDDAENYYLKALEIFHEEYGSQHEQTATLSNNLGALYHQAGYFEQAREMHGMALDVRRQLFGEIHSDTAQSYNNLALALIETGETKQALGYFQNSFRALEQLGDEYRDDLEAVGANYSYYLRRHGDQATADYVDKRIGATAQSS